MTSTTAFSALSVPAPDENMEMSSPALRNLDDDIEIDFDDFTSGVPLTDDERMLEDADITRPATAATDDMMEDATIPGDQALAEEEIMQDDGLQIQPLQQEDEELIDYGEDEIHEPQQDDTLLPSVVEEPGQLPEGGSEGLAIFEAPPLDLVDELTSETLAELPPDSEDFLGSVENPQEGVAVEAGHALVDDPTLDQSGKAAAFDHADQLEPQPDASQALQPISTSVIPQVDTPGTPTDTGLHSMMIRYADLRMPLFKSRRQPDGLLKDDNLASLSLAELIKNCRQRLAFKIGEDISEDQEIILAFDQLNLMLVEDSRACFETSLNEVLEVYLQLYHNDGVQEAPPLALSLSLQLKFASNFSVFKQAAAGGHGISSFDWMQLPANDDYYEEGFEDGDTTQQHGDEDDELAQGAHVDEAGQHEETEDFHEQEQTGEEADEYSHEDRYQEDEEYHEGTYPDAGDTEQPPPGLEELLQGEHQPTDSINDTLDDTAATGREEATENETLHLEAALGTANDADSRATSTTLRGDNVASNAGEYDDDLIDWDDEILTSDGSAGTANDPDEFATFLTDFEDDEHGGTAAKDDQLAVEDPAEQHDAFDLPGEHAGDQTYHAQHLASEDFLNDQGENEYEEQAYGGQEYEGEEEEYAPGEEEEDAEENYDQADTFGEQQDDYHPDYEPAEGKDQFHTAQDFLNGEYYEQGLEHEDDGAEDGLDDTLATVVHHPVEEYDEGETQEDIEDDLGFDDEAIEPESQQQQHQQDDNNSLKRTRSGSPLGKRSFDEHADEDDLDFEEHDAKRTRAS